MMGANNMVFYGAEVPDGIIPIDNLKVELCFITQGVYEYEGQGPKDAIKLAFSQSHQRKVTDTAFRVYGLEKKHGSPLEFADFVFKIEGLSRAALDQLNRHRDLSRYFAENVESQRYVDYMNELRVVVPDAIRNNINLLNVFLENCSLCHYTYRIMREQGIRKEDARSILPAATACNLVIKGDLRCLIMMWQQRSSYSVDGKAAQAEIKQLANKMVELVLPYFGGLEDDLLKRIECGIED